MGFYADLHVHSKFSRATSRDLDLERMALWARRKGVSVLGTGDFTHPGWFREIEEKLVPAEPGLFRLRPDLERQVDEALVPDPGTEGARFVLQVEISTIYKRGERTRKVHHLIFVPGLEAARRVSRDLARIGNIASDGRPILGLDSRDLLEIALSSEEGSYLIPAHIWTPWFAVLGASSGFDSIEECYGDLSRHIFALETGLSSDPPMNRRLSALDRYTLVSNSDAHSPAKIGREACLFECGLDFFAMRGALERGEGYGGTVEFFPEEGKYHYDGHRKCGTCLSPAESRKTAGACPVCGKALTLGVMSRVERLADRTGRAAPDGAPPAGAAPDRAQPGGVMSHRAHPHRSFIPLEEIIAEVVGSGPGSKAVARLYDGLLARLGPELLILGGVPVEEIEKAGSALIAEAIARMREGRVIREPGYDGEYGKIRLFERDELARRTEGSVLLELPGLEEPRGREPRRRRRNARPTAERRGQPSADSGSAEESREPPGSPGIPVPLGFEARNASGPSDLLDALDPEQREAVLTTEGAVAILAGPGTGKTRTLTHRIAHLVLERGVPPESCLAITFTRRAASEMAERLLSLLGERARRVSVGTFHSLGLGILREHGARLGLPGPIRVAGEAERRRLLAAAMGSSEREAGRLLDRISRRKRGGPDAPSDDAETSAAGEVYEGLLREGGLVDFDDLVRLPVRLLGDEPDIANLLRARHRWISVDEGQDMDRIQYDLVRLLGTPDGNVCLIGDPDQSIYGFRGADPGSFSRFLEDFPRARTVSLVRNYRSTRSIVEASHQVISVGSLVPGRRVDVGTEEPHGALGADRIEIHECASDRAEAELVVRTIESMLGGSSFYSVDSGRAEGHGGSGLSFGDFAVLYRTNALAGSLVEALARSGMPFQRRTHAPLAEAPGVDRLVSALETRAPRNGAEGARLPVSDLLELVAAEVEASGVDLTESIGPLRALAGRSGEDVEGFLSALALGVDSDLWDPRAEAVTLLTLHAAKGLEFPVVFVVGCEDGILPLRRDPEDAGDLAEERRLFFVGMTRARRRLVLARARRRAWRGASRAMEPSPFLRDIEEGLRSLHRHAFRAQPASRFRQLELFDAP